jgi:hypothetical protein
MLFNARETFNYNGREYILTPPNLATEDMFADYLGNFAIREVTRKKKAFGDAFETALTLVYRDVASGYYTWFGEGWAKAINSDLHFKELVRLILAQEPDNQLYPQQINEAWTQDSGEKKPDGSVLTLGEKMVQAIWGFINRKNSPSPAPTSQPG